MNTNLFSKTHCFSTLRLGICVAVSGLIGTAPDFVAHANPTAVDGSSFILVATNSSSVQLFGLAADGQGRIYAGNNSNGQPGDPVQVFDPSLFSETAVTFQNLGPACIDGDAITFGNGTLFIVDANSGVRGVTISNGASRLVISGVGENSTGSPLAYRPEDGHLFVGLGGLTGINRIDEYDTNGVFVKHHTTSTDVETMSFDAQAGLIYYAAFGSTVRSLNPKTDVDKLVGTVNGTIDGALTLDPLSKRLFVGTANGANSGIIETIDPASGTVSPFASGFTNALGIIRDPSTGNLYFLENHNLYRLAATNVNNSIPPITINGTSFTLVATNSTSTPLFGLVVDAQGRVYAGNNSNAKPGIPLQMFDPTVFLGTPIPFQNVGPACMDGDGITFGNGAVFIADGNSGVRELTVSNGTSTVFMPGIAVNETGSPMVYRPADGHIFVGLGGQTGINRIDEYDASGAFVKHHTTGADVETMTFDPQSGLIYYAAFGSAIRSLNPVTDTDRLVGTINGTIDGAMTLDPVSRRLFVGTANGANPGFVETMDPTSGSVAPIASGFFNSVGILRDPSSGKLYFLTDNNLFVLDSTNVNKSIPPVAINITLTNSIARTTWQVVPSNSYQLQFSLRLTPPAWTNINGAFTATSNRLDLIDTHATNASGFYRAALIQ